ncbi:YagK/YfjJ domain-containing protein, partial [Serratia sp. 506_PEND]
YTYHPYWQQRIADTFNCTLNAYTRVLALRVDLRLPDTPAATDAAVISRFIDALKARIDAYFKRHQREGKRIWP